MVWDSCWTSLALIFLCQKLDHQLLVVEEIWWLCEVFEWREDIAEESVVKLLLGLTVLTQKAVVVVAVFSGINPHKVTPSLVFQHRLYNNFFDFWWRFYKRLHIFFLFRIHEFSWHCIYLLIQNHGSHLQSIVSISCLNDFPSDFTLKKVAWSTNTRVVACLRAFRTSRAHLGYMRLISLRLRPLTSRIRCERFP